MQRTPDGRILVVADTSFVINFLAIRRLDILGNLRSYSFQVPNHVVAEVKLGEQVTLLTSALDQGILTQFEVTDHDEIRRYGEFRRYLGDG